MSASAVLLLGPNRGITLRIAEQLKLQVFEVVLPGLSDELLPAATDPQAVDKMRGTLAHSEDVLLLIQFIESATGRGLTK